MAFFTKSFGALGSGIGSGIKKGGKHSGANKIGKKYGRKYSGMGNQAFNQLMEGDVFGMANTAMDIFDEGTGDYMNMLGKVSKHTDRYTGLVDQGFKYGLLDKSIQENENYQTIRGGADELSKGSKKHKKKFAKSSGKLRNKMDGYNDKLTVYDIGTGGALSNLKKGKKKNKKSVSYVDDYSGLQNADVYVPPMASVEPVVTEPTETTQRKYRFY